MGEGLALRLSQVSEKGAKKERELKSAPFDVNSGWTDLNRRPLVPQTSTLNPCATTRNISAIRQEGNIAQLPYRVNKERKQ